MATPMNGWNANEPTAPIAVNAAKKTVCFTADPEGRAESVLCAAQTVGLGSPYDVSAPCARRHSSTQICLHDHVDGVVMAIASELIICGTDEAVCQGRNCQS